MNSSTLRSQLVIMPVLLVILFTLGLFAFSSVPICAGNLPARDALNQAPTSMDVAISRVPMTGDPDVDFAVMMISHHQGAVEWQRSSYSTELILVCADWRKKL
ncbi:MAG: hypothetical protein KME10_27740 [Plectolyngbya sp. WJT66-NPBG17]|jgi:uncharacterized protein (DUF305 family)|nr:hypothetical protein [Plectolyngbya sp. WJT66-NPBG17]